MYKRGYIKSPFFFENLNPSPQKKRHKKEISLDLSQTPLLKKINTYFKKMGRKNKNGSNYQTTPGGYCHGLTLLFLEKMAEGRVQWFYDTKRKIIECKESQLEVMEIEIEKLLAMIEWAQNSSKYTQKKISYCNVDLILETQTQQVCDGSYTFKQLTKFLTYKQGKGNMICITSYTGKDKDHSIGIFTDGVCYHLFDANYKSGQATSFRSSKELAKEILNQLYTNLDEKIPSKAQLEIKIVNQPAVKNRLYRTDDSFFKKTTIKENKMLKQEDIISNSGDEVELKIYCAIS